MHQYFSSRYLNNENETTISRYWGSNTPVNCETESINYAEGTESICYGQARRKRSSDLSDYPPTPPPAPSYGTGSCIFPYEYKGKTYYECIEKIFGYDENYWCPIELDDNDQPNNWGRCGENCPSSRLRNGYKGHSFSPKFASKFDSSNQNLLGIINF